MKSIDIHNQKEKYNRLLNQITNLPLSRNKEILQAYADWHNNQIDQNKIAHSSSYRSLSHAIKICDYFPNVEKATQKQVEEWFSKEIEKPKVQRTGADTLKPSTQKRSVETLEDVSTQGIKFFKFVTFLSKGKPLLLFNSKRCSLPEQFEFISVDTSKRKEYEKPRITQKQIKELVDYLWNSKNHLEKMTGLLICLLSDTGMRFSEGVTLQIQDIQPEEDYLILNIRESKTKTRTVVSMLAKSYLINWLGSHPKKNNPEALVFFSGNGNKVSYANMRNVFFKAIKVLKINWREGQSFHFLRHLFASRATKFSDFHLRYWMGWNDKSMRAHYSNNTYLDCLGYYKQMILNEENPFIDARLCLIEEKQKSERELLLEEMREMIKKEINKN